MFDLKGKHEHVFFSILNKYIYALIRSSTEHKLFMYLTSIIIKRHKHQIFWDLLARRAANNRKSKQRRGNNVL